MIKYIIIAVCVIGAGAMGYVGERFMRPTTSAPSDQAASQELMFKMPLGKFTPNRSKKKPAKQSLPRKSCASSTLISRRSALRG